MNLLAVLITKVVIATGLAAVAEVVRKRAAHPETAYVLWASVLAVLIMPSVFAVAVPTQISASVYSTIENLPTLFTAEGTDGRVPGESAEMAGLTGALLGVAWQVCFTVWIVGCLFAWHRRIGALRQLARFVELAPEGSSDVRTRCSELATELGVGQTPKVVTADGSFSPFLWDPICGPTLIVIPVALLEQFSADSLDAILRHELIHLRRRDAWRHRVQFLIATLWRWLPTASLARRRLLRLEELCTDAAVVRANPDFAHQYARALLDTEELLAGTASREFTVVPAFTQGLFLRERIVNIVGDQPKPFSQRRKLAGCAVVATSISLGMLTAALPPHAETSQSLAKISTGHVTTQDGEFRNESSVPHPPPPEIFLPDSETVSVSRTDREIVLVWCRLGGPMEIYD